MEAQAAGEAQPGAVGTLGLIDIRDTALSVDEVLGSVRMPAAGGIALFIGAVRDCDGGRAVSALDYAAHPAALATLRAVADRVLAEHPALRLAAVHRVGDLAVGDLAVVVAAAAAHREAAFEACRALIDNLKSEVPIWKHQQFPDGSAEWVGSP